MRGETMGWLVGLLALVIFGWLLITYPGFRIAVLLTFACLVVAIIYFISAQNAREAKSRSQIPPSQVELGDATLREQYGSWKIAGTIKNNSPYTLTGLTVKITVRDCPENTACVVIGEDDAIIYSVTVPPSQLRTFDGYVNLNNMPIPKKLVWNYQLVQTTARVD
jgi:hypothetical protein